MSSPDCNDENPAPHLSDFVLAMPLNPGQHQQNADEGYTKQHIARVHDLPVRVHAKENGHQKDHRGREGCPCAYPAQGRNAQSARDHSHCEGVVEIEEQRAGLGQVRVPGLGQAGETDCGHAQGQQLAASAIELAKVRCGACGSRFVRTDVCVVDQGLQNQKVKLRMIC
jgi:hypothetical protein